MHTRILTAGSHASAASHIFKDFFFFLSKTPSPPESSCSLYYLTLESNSPTHIITSKLFEPHVQGHYLIVGGRAVHSHQILKLCGQACSCVRIMSHLGILGPPPVPLAKNNIILQLAKISAWFTENRIVFNIHLPLTSDQSSPVTVCHQPLPTSEGKEHVGRSLHVLGMLFSWPFRWR